MRKYPCTFLLVNKNAGDAGDAGTLHISKTIYVTVQASSESAYGMHVYKTICYYMYMYTCTSSWSSLYIFHTSSY